jgi:hypothetical protein
MDVGKMTRRRSRDRDGRTEHRRTEQCLAPVRRRTVKRPIAARARWIVGAVLVAVAFYVIVPRLGPGLDPGPSAIHFGPILTSRITVCERQYHAAGGPVQSLAEIDVNELTPVLVDPGFLGLVPSCPAPNPDGNRPCSRDPSAGPCATVVYVRVGVDAYAGYELAGGP